MVEYTFSICAKWHLALVNLSSNLDLGNFIFATHGGPGADEGKRQQIYSILRLLFIAQRIDRIGSCSLDRLITDGQ